MKKGILLTIMVLMAAMASAQTAFDNIIPQPKRVYQALKGDYSLRRGMTIWADGNDTRLSAEYLKDYCYRYLGLTLNIVNDSTGAAVKLQHATISRVKGAYAMTINASGISIVDMEGSGEGAFNGVQTLIQLLPARAGIIPQIHYGEIEDSPANGYRGMHFDVVRHFYPVSVVKQYIDWLALHKFNYFHWHLTDDQGWRIELKSHPELTQKGSYRAGEIKGLFPGVYQEMPYEAYYTQEEIKEVIDYAAKRFITVVPEIDMPGHCMAILAAHPEFSTTPNEPKHTAQTWGIYGRQNNVLAPSKEVFKFLDDVFEEVCNLFPGPYIHAGGDECSPKWWKASKETQQFMKENNLADEHALQAYFMRHVQRIINRHGKTMIAWSGGGEGADPNGSIVEHWHLSKRNDAAHIDSTHKWITSSGKYLYFDFKEDSTQTEITPGHRFILDVKAVYDFPVVPDSASSANNVGVEGCCWTEYNPTIWKIQQMLFPRLAALSENAWCDDNRTPKDWPDFSRRLMRQLDRYDLWNISYSPYFEKSMPKQRQR